MKTKLIFVRHGEARGNIDRVFHGFTNAELTKNGKRQAQRAAKRLENEPIDCIYSSDLKRAYETALTIAGPHGLDVIIDAHFREINGGQWENVPWSQLPVLFPESYQVWLDKPHMLIMPGGESMAEFFNRLEVGVTDILERHCGRTVCIATHGTSIRVLCCYFKHKGLTALNEIEWCDNAAITIVEHDENGFNILLEGDNSHLLDITTIGHQDWWKK